VIHAASMGLGGITTSHALRSSMQHAFRLARENGVRTIAIPAVGTGIAQFPIDECAIIMAGCLRDALIDGWAPEQVRFVLFGEAAKRAFEGPFLAFFQAPFDPAS
jgi:O-acetyl-ADP-ribose deacetylase (regulator of RNase III)